MLRWSGAGEIYASVSGRFTVFVTEARESLACLGWRLQLKHRLNGLWLTGWTKSFLWLPSCL